MSNRAVAKMFGRHLPNNLRLVDRFQVTQFTRNQERPGWQRVTTPRQGRHSIRRHLQGHTLPATCIAATARCSCGSISADTDRQRTELHVCRSRMSTQHYRDNLVRHHVVILMICEIVLHMGVINSTIRS